MNIHTYANMQYKEKKKKDKKKQEETETVYFSTHAKKNLCQLDPLGKLFDRISILYPNR